MLSVRSRVRASAALGLALAAGAARGDEPRLADYFGFKPLEVYKLDDRIANLIVRDLDGDKIDDIAVANNGRSRIDLLLSTKAKPGGETAAAREINQVQGDRRMRSANIAVNQEVVSLQAGDLDGDGKTDLAFYGTPAELIVLKGDGAGKFTELKRIPSGEAIESGGALTVGDLNRDGRADLALLASGEVVTILGLEGGRLGEPERLPHTATSPRFVKAVDLDGDGGDDLVILDGVPDDPVRVRFSAEGGRLGPEQRFAIEPLRAYAFADVDGRPGAEMLTVEQQSGRTKVLTLAEADSQESGRRGRLIFHPLPQGNARGRSLDLGDLDGDGLVDVVATDPANAQFLVYRQSGKAGLGTARTFPGLVGGKVVKLGDLDGDKKAEVYVVSEQEKQIGRSVFDGGRLSFPSPLPSSGEPVALDLADLDGDKVPEIVYVSKNAAGSGPDAYAIRALKREKSGTLVPFRWASEDAVALKGLSGAPPALRVFDANRDGQADFLVFNAFGAPTLLLGRPGEPPAPGGGLGPLSGVTPAGLTLANLDGPALIVAQNTFARNLTLGKDGSWEVKDQYNTGKGSAQVVGAAALDTDGDGKPEIALLDRNSKSLIFLDSKDGVYRPGGTLSVGPIDFQGMHVADLDGDGKDDLLLAGTDRFGVVLTGRKGQRLKTLASYEPSREEARIADLAAGDLNGDGKPDLVLTDVGEHFVEIVSFPGPDRAELDRALSFRVFEEKSFRDADSQVEPRDLGLGDVDGDGRTDLVLIVHDRVLIYRQDPGPESKKAD